MFLVLSVDSDDYQSDLEVPLTITAAETSVTHSIMIMDDNINEEPESFTAALTGPASTDPDILFVDVFPATATVNIVDDDGKELCSILQVFLKNTNFVNSPMAKY